MSRALSGIVAMCALGFFALRLGAQTPEPTNTAPNPYKTVEQFLKMPDGRTWGSTSAGDGDRAGRSRGGGGRGGGNSCVASAPGQMSCLPSIRELD